MLNTQKKKKRLRKCNAGRRPWGLLPKKIGTGMCDLEELLFMPSLPFARPTAFFISQRLLKTLLSPPNHKFLVIWSSEASKLAKSSVLKPQILRLHFVKKFNLLESKNSAMVCSQSPLFCSPCHTLTPKWNFECPLHHKTSSLTVVAPDFFCGGGGQVGDRASDGGGGQMPHTPCRHCSLMSRRVSASIRSSSPKVQCNYNHWVILQTIVFRFNVT